jgi:hypothetical protein
MQNKMLIYYAFPFLIACTLFLPHHVYDLYTGGIFSSRELVQKNVKESGLAYFFCFIPFISVLGSSLMATLHKSVATSIVALVLTCLTLLYMPFEAFALTFNIFGPEKNSHVGIGYWLKTLLLLLFLGYIIYDLVVRVKEKRKNKSEIRTESDLLDDF